MKKRDYWSDAWYHIYGKGSHLNVAGKIILGVPLAPFVFLILLLVWIAERLFTREGVR